MIKEIYEQPKAIEDTLLPRIRDSRIDLTDAGITDEMMKNVKKHYDRCVRNGEPCGASGKYAIEQLARIPVTVDTGSGFRYRNPILKKAKCS